MRVTSHMMSECCCDIVDIISREGVGMYGRIAQRLEHQAYTLAVLGSNPSAPIHVHQPNDGIIFPNIPLRSLVRIQEGGQSLVFIQNALVWFWRRGGRR